MNKTLIFFKIVPLSETVADIYESWNKQWMIGQFYFAT